MLVRITRFRFRRITSERGRRSEDVPLQGIHYPCNLPQPSLTGLHPVAWIHPAALVPVPVVITQLPAPVEPAPEIPYGDSWTWLRVGL